MTKPLSTGGYLHKNTRSKYDIVEFTFRSIKTQISNDDVRYYVTKAYLDDRLDLKLYANYIKAENRYLLPFSRI